MFPRVGLAVATVVGVVASMWGTGTEVDARDFCWLEFNPKTDGHTETAVLYGI